MLCGVLLVGASCWLLNFSLETPIEDYRPDYQVDLLSPDSISRIATEITHDAVTFRLSWSTVDSPTFGKGPYKLRIVVMPNREPVAEVLFDSVRVESDRAAYQFSSRTTWPALPVQTTPYWKDIVFEPAFDFDHDAGERVTTRIWCRIEDGPQITSQYSELRWVPVSYRKFFPIV